MRRTTSTFARKPLQSPVSHPRLAWPCLTILNFLLPQTFFSSLMLDDANLYYTQKITNIRELDFIV